MLFDRQREIGRYDKGGIWVSTKRVWRGDRPIETEVAHPCYDDGTPIGVEAYDTDEAAREGHHRWVRTMTGDELPETLTEICNSSLAKFFVSVGVETVFPKQEPAT